MRSVFTIQRVLLGLAAFGMLTLAGLFYFQMPSRPSALAPTPLSVSLLTEQAPPNAPAETSVEPEESGSQRNTQSLLTLNTAMDYALLKAQLEPLAEKGDAVALRTIAEIYAYCQQYSWSPSRYRADVESKSQLYPDNAAHYTRIAETVEARCKNLDGGERILKEQRELYLVQAAEAGDTYAKIRLAMSEQAINPAVQLSAQQVDELVDEALSGADPEAIMHVGDLLAVNSAGSQYQEFSGQIAQFAWMVAACRRGGANFCSQGSLIMTDACLNHGGCRYLGLEDYFRRGVLGEQDVERLDMFLRAIEAKLPPRN